MAICLPSFCRRGSLCQRYRVIGHLGDEELIPLSGGIFIPIGVGVHFLENIINFMREICAIPSMDGQLKEVGDRIGAEMTKLGFEEVRFDKMGNIMGRIGSGKRVIVYDSHIDTVGIGDPASWQWDPFKGKIEDGRLYARGACDEKGSTPGMIYGLAFARDLGLLDGYTAYYFGNMEEWCDGIAPNAFVEADPQVHLEPEALAAVAALAGTVCVFAASCAPAVNGEVSAAASSRGAPRTVVVPGIMPMAMFNRPKKSISAPKPRSPKRRTLPQMKPPVTGFASPPSRATTRPSESATDRLQESGQSSGHAVLTWCPPPGFVMRQSSLAPPGRP